MNGSEDLIIRANWAIMDGVNLKKDVTLLIQNGTISAINPQSNQIPRGCDVYEFGNSVVTPGFINAHTHIPETLIRGICDDKDLHTWLYDHVWQVEPQLNEERAKIGTLLGIAEMIASGTIGFIDQFYFADKIAEAVHQTGIKAMLAPSIFDGNAETGSIENAYKQNLKVIREWHGKDNRIFIGFGPHAPYTVDEGMFTKIATKAIEYDTFIHTHLNETMREVKEAEEKWGETPIERMARLNILDRTLAAHCVHVSDKDMELLVKNNTTVLHNIQSNLKLGSGIAPVPTFLDRNINILLGTDGSASNNNLSILEEMRLTALIHKGINKDPKLVKTSEVVKMATSNASKVFPFNSYNGVIRENTSADLVVFDLENVRGIPVINPLSNLLYSLSDADVSLTMSNGKSLYYEDEFQTIDMENLLDLAQRATDEMMIEADYTPKL